MLADCTILLAGVRRHIDGAIAPLEACAKSRDNKDSAYCGTTPLLGEVTRPLTAEEHVRGVIECPLIGYFVSLTVGPVPARLGLGVRACRSHFGCPPWCGLSFDLRIPGRRQGGRGSRGVCAQLEVALPSQLVNQQVRVRRT